MQQGMALIDLQKKYPDLDFWTEPSLQEGTDIMVSPKQLVELQSYLSKHGIGYEILIQDVGR